MSKTSLILNNFVYGKLDHDLNGRFEMPFYSKGFESCKNFISGVKGNLKNRTGFEFVDDTNANLLKEFKFNTEQAYLMAFGDKILKFYTYDSAGVFGKITNIGGSYEQPTFIGDYDNGITSPAGYSMVTRVNDEDYTTGLFWKILNIDDPNKDYDTLRTLSGELSYFDITFPNYFTPTVIEYEILVNSFNGLGMFELSYLNDSNEWVLVGTYGEKLDATDCIKGKRINVSVNASKIKSKSWRVDPIPDPDSPTGPHWFAIKFHGILDGQSETTGQDYIETDIPLSDTKDLKFAQNGDVIYLTRKGSVPKTITRYSSDYFSYESATINGIDFEEFGNPRCCCFYQNRLWLAGFTNKPTTICASEVGNYENFEIPTSDIKDSDPLELTLSDISDPILWCVGGKDNLNLGNGERISIVNGGTTGITSTNVNASHSNNEGSNSVQPLSYESNLFYCSNDGSKIYTYSYDLLTESFISRDRTMLVRDLLKNSISRIVLKNDKDDFIYLLTGDYKIICMSFKGSEDVNGYFPFETYGKVLDIETVTRPDGKKDLFAIIKDDRGSTGYIDLVKLSDDVSLTNYYDTDFENDIDAKKYNRLICEEIKYCNYLDCSTIYKKEFNIGIKKGTTGRYETTETGYKFTSKEFSGHKVVIKTKTGEEYGVFSIPNLTEEKLYLEADGEVSVESFDKWYLTFDRISNLDEFEGEYLSVVADGKYIGEKEVDNGVLLLGGEYSVVCIGYKYESSAITFNIGGNYQTAVKNINKIIARFINTSGGKIGTKTDNLFDVHQFNPNGFYDTSALLLNGDVEIIPVDSSENDKRLMISQKNPLPFEITMIELTIDNRRIL